MLFDLIPLLDLFIVSAGAVPLIFPKLEFVRSFPVPVPDPGISFLKESVNFLIPVPYLFLKINYPIPVPYFFS
jgi:hypothetical protein